MYLLDLPLDNVDAFSEICQRREDLLGGDALGDLIEGEADELGFA